MHFLECFYLKSSVATGITMGDNSGEVPTVGRGKRHLRARPGGDPREKGEVDKGRRCGDETRVSRGGELRRGCVQGGRIRPKTVFGSVDRFYNCRRMFQNEVAAYEWILPMFQSYLDQKSRNESAQLCFPRYYGQCQRFLVVQDLQTEGYQQVNRQKGFSVRECSLVLRELSKFHALSIVLKKEKRLAFSKTIDRLQETIFREEHIHDLTGLIWENSVKFAIKSLRASKDPRLEGPIEALGLYSGRVLRTLIDLVKPDFGKFDVLCHGDLWSNNILLRYCDSGYPIGVKLIDLQAMRYGSCVLDVMHVLFTSSRPVVCERYLDLLLAEYYTSLVANLRNLDAVPGFTLEEFLGELKRKLPYGEFLACIMLTCVTRTSPFEPSESNLNLKDLTSESELEKTYNGLSSGYHERLRALFLALTSSGLI